MQLGMIGLGKMGANMVRRIMAAGIDCVVFDRDPAAVKALEAEGALGAESISKLCSLLAPPRAIWVMVPSGEATESVVRELGTRLVRGDVIIDGGNSYFKDDVRRAGELVAHGIYYMDVGTSGGVWGAERGYCLMIGGPDACVKRVKPVFEALAPGRGEIPRTPGRAAAGGTAELGYLHCGPAGSGHYVKMIHNGIEYGVMQAYAEGFELMRSADAPGLPEAEQFDLNVADVAEVWRRGSVISSWLLDLSATALLEDPNLDGYSGHVSDSGEGRWTVQAAVDQAVPADVLTSALFKRFRSRQEQPFADKVLSAMRKQFGGHVEPGAGAGNAGGSTDSKANDSD
jgi:6-phosphogluconate dehydrogenase